MSYSDRSSAGAAGGVGGVLIIILLIGLRVGLKAMARASRNADWSTSQVDDTPPSIVPQPVDNPLQAPGIPHPSPPTYDQQQEDARRVAEQQEQDRIAQRDRQLADQAARDAQYQADQQARQQEQANRLAQQEADRLQREQELANIRNNPPPVPVVPMVEQPAPPNPAPQPAAEVIPGFAATDIDQIKPRTKVFVQANGQWILALVQLKRGQLIQVRDLTSGNTEAVTLDRIRLESEPVAKVESALPGALRAVAGSARTGAGTEPEDDSLFIAKPKKDDDEEPAAAALPAETPSATSRPASGSKPKPSPAHVRTWTNDTGAFKVDAEFVGFEFGLVQLRRLDGKVISLAIDKLSAADQQFVREKAK